MCIRDSGKTVQSLTGQAMAQLPRLARLEQVGHDTRISLGLSLIHISEPTRPY